VRARRRIIYFLTLRRLYNYGTSCVSEKNTRVTLCLLSGMATQEQKDEQCPELRLAQTLFMLATPDVVGDKAALLAALQADIFEHGASPTFHCLPPPVAPAGAGVVRRVFCVWC